MDNKPLLGPIPTINAEQLAKNWDKWEEEGFPVSTPENDQNQTEV